MRHLSLASYMEFLVTHKECAIYFGAPWCCACNAAVGKLSRITEHMAVGQMDVEEDRHEYVMHFGLKVLPTIIFYKEGVEVCRWEGSNVEIGLNAMDGHHGN